MKSFGVILGQISIKAKTRTTKILSLEYSVIVNFEVRLMKLISIVMTVPRKDNAKFIISLSGVIFIR